MAKDPDTWPRRRGPRHRTAASKDPRLSGPTVLDPRVLASEGAGLGVDTYLRAWACNEIGIHTYFQIMACNDIGKKLENQVNNIIMV